MGRPERSVANGAICEFLQDCGSCEAAEQSWALCSVERRKFFKIRGFRRFSIYRSDQGHRQIMFFLLSRPLCILRNSLTAQRSCTRLGRWPSLLPTPPPVKDREGRLSHRRGGDAATRLFRSGRVITRIPCYNPCRFFQIQARECRGSSARCVIILLRRKAPCFYPKGMLRESMGSVKFPHTV